MWLFIERSEIWREGMRGKQGEGEREGHRVEDKQRKREVKLFGNSQNQNGSLKMSIPKFLDPLDAFITFHCRKYL